MANGCLRSLKVISENPLIRINEFENMTQRLNWLPLEDQRGPVRLVRTDNQFSHVLARDRASPLADEAQIARRKADRRKAHAARDVGRLEREMQPVGGRVHRLNFAARRLDQETG